MITYRVTPPCVIPIAIRGLAHGIETIYYGTLGYKTTDNRCNHRSKQESGFGIKLDVHLTSNAFLDVP